MRRSKLLRQILHVLANHPETRDNDRKLQTIFFTTYFPDEFDGGYMRPGALERMTNADDIVRLRALIQNNHGLYLSRTPEIRHKRRQSDAAWKQWILLAKSPTQLREYIRKNF